MPYPDGVSAAAGPRRIPVLRRQPAAGLERRCAMSDRRSGSRRCTHDDGLGEHGGSFRLHQPVERT